MCLRRDKKMCNEEMKRCADRLDHMQRISEKVDAYKRIRANEWLMNLCRLERNCLDTSKVL